MKNPKERRQDEEVEDDLELSGDDFEEDDADESIPAEEWSDEEPEHMSLPVSASRHEPKHDTRSHRQVPAPAPQHESEDEGSSSQSVGSQIVLDVRPPKQKSESPGQTGDRVATPSAEVEEEAVSHQGK